MEFSKQIIRLILGLKVKQLREQLQLSLDVVSKKSGISRSYINEIENGKKYPQGDKLMALANALNVKYDDLVSLKLSGNLEPLNAILLSDRLNTIPLKSFGLDETTLSDLLIKNPYKTQLMLSTLLNLSKNQGLNKQDFINGALLAHAEAHNNYFDPVEKKAVEFKKLYDAKSSDVKFETLVNYAFDAFKLTVNILNTTESDSISETHSIFIKETNSLLLHSSLNEKQRIFCIVREFYFQIEKDIKRKRTHFPLTSYSSFEQGLNAFYSAYFALAFFAPKQLFIKDFNTLFDSKTWNEDTFLNISASYNLEPAMLLRRLAVFLKSDFNFERFLLMRLSKSVEKETHDLTMEAKWVELDQPHSNEAVDNFCKKSLSRQVIDDNSRGVIRIQKDNLHVNYLVLNFITLSVLDAPLNDSFHPKSLSLVIVLTDHVKEKIKFLEDNTIPSQDLGLACQSCIVEECSVRMSPAYSIRKTDKNLNLEKAVEAIKMKFS